MLITQVKHSWAYHISMSMNHYSCVAAAQNVSSLAKALAVVATEDEHTVLKQVMSKLSTVEESIQQIYEEQADSDFFTFSELLKDYLSLISAVKVRNSSATTIYLVQL